MLSIPDGFSQAVKRQPSSLLALSRAALCSKMLTRREKLYDTKQKCVEKKERTTAHFVAPSSK